MNPVTVNQMNMIKKVQLILEETFTGRTKQDAFLWLRDRVPKAEKRLEELALEHQNRQQIQVRSITEYKPYMSSIPNPLEQIRKHSPDYSCFSVEDIDRNIEFLMTMMR